MNTYYKYCPNVFLAKCKEEHQKGEIIILTTKRGKENKHIVFNRIGTSKDGCFFYSIIREDGYNLQERAKRKAEKYRDWAESRERKSTEAFNNRATKHELDFLSLGEPVKVGHHSEKRHRKLFEKYDNKMRQSIEHQDKAEEHINKAKYYESLTEEINLSIPESIEYFAHKLEEATKRHKGLKEGTIKREHSYSLTYANKDRKEAEKKYKIAVKLWGDCELIKEVYKK